MFRNNMKTVWWQLLKWVKDATLLKTLKEKVTALQVERVNIAWPLNKYADIVAQAQAKITEYTEKINKIDMLMDSALKEIEILSPKIEKAKTDVTKNTIDNITNIPKSWADLYIK